MIRIAFFFFYLKKLVIIIDNCSVTKCLKRCELFLWTPTDFLSAIFPYSIIRAKRLINPTTGRNLLF